MGRKRERLRKAFVKKVVGIPAVLEVQFEMKMLGCAANCRKNNYKSLGI